ncbi:MAG TPA: hypothetical protein VLA58_01030 [Chitinophagaceae bacterium]|nr:hypothetical protein [Chitinophagaceae bacterium]
MSSVITACEDDLKPDPENTVIVQTNKPPVADAGKDHNIILPVNSVELDGSASSDPDNNTLRFFWRKLSGPLRYTISNDNMAKPKLTDLVQGMYEFELKVSDSAGLHSKDTVLVAVNDTILIADADIYVIGVATRNYLSERYAVLWKNGLEQILGNGSDFNDPVSIFVSGEDVYVAGRGSAANHPGNGVVAVWKNGVVQNWTDGSNIAYASFVFVSGPDVYVAGSEAHPVTRKPVAKIWKNGVAQNLTDGSTFAGANSVFLSEGNIYVAGFEVNSDGSYVAKIWKNGVSQNLTDGSNGGFAKSIFVADGNVYVTGYDQTAHMLWKNGVTQVYSASMLNSVFISGSDIYVAGHRDYDYIGYPALWKNGVTQNLDNALNYGEANSVFVLDTNVYVAGWTLDQGTSAGTAKLWINGSQRNLAPNSYTSAAAAVFVVKK